jgi:cytoplasmic tRNA 2-thiolation protein 1
LPPRKREVFFSLARSKPLLLHLPPPQLCKECFYAALEREVHATIVEHGMFKRGERVAVCASGKIFESYVFFSFSLSLGFFLFTSSSLFPFSPSPPPRFDYISPSLSLHPTITGGKDSTALAHIMSLLNKRHDYGLDLFLLSVDEGISGYRDDSLATVRRNEAFYGLPLTVISFEELFGGMTVDRAAQVLGTKSRCTLCGVLRRQALDRGAALCRADKLATGHNADDVAETLLLNLVRGDAARMARCGGGQTGGKEGGRERGEGNEEATAAAEATTTAAAAAAPRASAAALALPRVKPFLHTYEKEIVLYAHHKRLDYFCTECSHAKFAARGGPREAVKAMEAAAPASVAGLVRTAVALSEAAARFAADSNAAAAAAAAAASASAADTAAAPGRKKSGGKKPLPPPPSPSSAAAAALSSSPGECERCGGLSSGAVCKACELLGQLALGVDEKGRALAGAAGGGGGGGGRAGARAKRAPVRVAFEA